MARPPLPASNDVGWSTTLNNGIWDVSDRADAALSITSGVPGVVQVESFTGTDSAKMTAALSYAAAQTNAPWLQLPARTFNTGSTSYGMFTGMKILGAGYSAGPKNLEISSGKPVVGKWQTSCGTGASSLLGASAEVRGVSVAGVAFQGASSSQIFRSTVNIYPCYFEALTFYGCKHAFGNPAEKFLITQGTFHGHFTALGPQDTQFTFGGSDCFFSWYLNIDPAAAGGGKPLIILDNLGKTDMHYNYVTAENDWIGLQIKGSLDRKLALFGGTYEGRSLAILATRALVDIQGQHVIMYSPHLGQVSDSGSTNGVITQSGGRLDLYSPLYLRGTGVAPTFPLLYQTGGTACVRKPVSVNGETIAVRWSTGTTDTIPLPSNSYEA